MNGVVEYNQFPLIPLLIKEAIMPYWNIHCQIILVSINSTSYKRSDSEDIQTEKAGEVSINSTSYKRSD